MSEDERTFLCGYQRQRRYGTTATPTSSAPLPAAFLRHPVLPTDTLQGIALRYGVSMTEIKRLNRLWSNESIYLKETLLVPQSSPIPVENGNSTASSGRGGEAASSSVTTPPPPDPSIADILSRIDSTIRTTAKSAEKLQRESTVDEVCQESWGGGSWSGRSVSNPSSLARPPSPTEVSTEGRRDLTNKSMRKLKDAHDRFYQL